MVRRFDVYCNGGWDGCTTYEEDCDCGDYVSAVDYAELVEAVRWERRAIRVFNEACMPNAGYGEFAWASENLEKARAAVDALVREG